MTFETDFSRDEGEQGKNKKESGKNMPDRKRKSHGNVEMAC